MSEVLEENLLDEYYILVKRIPGLAMSIEDFMNTPSRQISYLLDKEYELLEYENMERERVELAGKTTSKGGTMVPNRHRNSKEAEKAIESYVI